MIESITPLPEKTDSTVVSFKVETKQEIFNRSALEAEKEVFLLLEKYDQPYSSFQKISPRTWVIIMKLLPTPLIID